MGSKANPSEHDCYSRAEPDEPLFVLLGRDPSASLMIDIWIALRRETDANDEKLDEAAACAEACLSWAHKKGKAAKVHALAVAWDSILGSVRPHDRLAFDLAIGRLDHVMSQLIGWAKDKTREDADKQTLKHHAEDMIAAGEKILIELAPTYTCDHCGVASPKDQWGPGRVVCPACKRHAKSAEESAA